MTQANEANEGQSQPLNAGDIERIRTAEIFASALDQRVRGFNADIEPLLKQIADAARAHGIPFIAAFDITTAKNMRDDGAFNMAVGCFLPEAPYSERLRQTFAILRPRTREEQLEEQERLNELVANLAKQGIVIGEGAPVEVPADPAADDHEGSTPD